MDTMTLTKEQMELKAMVPAVQSGTPASGNSPQPSAAR